MRLRSSLAGDEEDQTVLSASSAEQGVAYKTHGARATDPGKDQGEANAPFVDNKLSLFFSAVNGVRPFVRKWWDFLDGVERIARNVKRGSRSWIWLLN